MSAKLENYLEEISHFLAVGPGREEILSEIRSHILEKAEDEQGRASDAVIEKVIADFGPARKVAERYLEGQEIIAPAYQRHLFRYTSLLFAVHFLFTLIGVIFGKSFVIFPFFFVPQMGFFEALTYLTMAFLADLGLVTLILYFITRSKKDIKLPWPKFAVDLDEIKPPMKFGDILAKCAGLIAMLALTGFVIRLFVRHGTIFFQSMDIKKSRPLFMAEAGRSLSLILIALLVVGTVSLFVRFFTRSRWVDVCSDVATLALLSAVPGRPFNPVFSFPVSERLLSVLKWSFWITFFIIVLFVTIDLIKNLIILGRKKLADQAGRSRV